MDANYISWEIIKENKLKR